MNREIHAGLFFFFFFSLIDSETEGKWSVSETAAVLLRVP